MHDQQLTQPAAPTTKSAPNNLLSPAEVAVWLSMPVRRIHDNWRLWQLPFRRVGKYLRMSRHDLEAWFMNQPRA